ncbi:TrbG/VirB9 family P-type conjugative transfer protein [Acidipila sp. EB88]|uniref:TrbG/VirB9 family P-type conjugative transfer protein n=1 Tax=Acidipila sp. EB88 TaxID=2305226 RepID=UPI000F5E5398|nr:TrbG/VirB9 family P-type conjugative transfer protein [Acidipila sp. EB88]RRA50449.1 conjugal transfer protein [Acidipila sp. EB88]
MKVLAIAALLLTPGLFADAEIHRFQPSPPRTVVFMQAAAPPVIRTGVLQSTLIALPAEEKVATVFVGDTEGWVVDGGHVASRYISVKPKVPNAATDVHIISDHGNEYTLELREVSTDGDSHFDSNVILSAGDKGAQDKISQLPVFLPAAEVEKARADAAAAQAAAEKTRKDEQAKVEADRAAYPAKVHFDYEWNHEKGRELGIQQIWRDDKFTYIRGKFQETPALYELKDKKGSLVNFDFADGLYTVPKQLEDGYLTIGKTKVEFKRTGEGS